MVSFTSCSKIQVTKKPLHLWANMGMANLVQNMSNENSRMQMEKYLST
jgi:hypothetical protein